MNNNNNNNNNSNNSEDDDDDDDDNNNNNNNIEFIGTYNFFCFFVYLILKYNSFDVNLGFLLLQFF